MRVIQLMPTITYGDAVSNHAIAIAELLKSMSYDTDIYAENIGTRLPEGYVKHVNQMTDLSEDDVVIYHASTGTALNKALSEMPGRKLMIYHNITPPNFFREYSPVAEKLTSDGLDQMRYLSDKVDYCIADSEFNKEDLRKLGFTCPIDVCPLLIEFNDYAQDPSSQVIDFFGKDCYTNLLFVGRIAPNKKQENVIRAFYFYKKYFNKKSRLYLVGDGEGLYLESLKDYTSALGLDESVVFTGKISFSEVLAYYHIADVFVCMSEHEGFCVPLAEAMYFDKPIIAYGNTAIPYTLGGSGVLLDSNSPISAAEAINKVVADKDYRMCVLDGQRKRLRDFDQSLVAETMRKLICTFIER